MLLSKAQLTLFWRSWSAACTTQGWTRAAGWTVNQIDDKRHEMLKGLGFASLKDVDNRGFDRVLAKLRLLADRVDGAVDEVRPQNGDARRLLWRIEWLAKCIELYKPGQSEAYIAGVVQDKFAPEDKYGTGVLHPRHWRDLSAVRSPGKEDSELDQLRMTLTARLNGRTGMRVEHGESVHDMCSRAGVTCACEACKEVRAHQARARAAAPVQRTRKPISRPAPTPVVAGGGEEDNNNPF